MEIKILILITMIFCHIVDDYYLQGWLSQAKQRSFWIKNAPDPLYKHDYIVALFMHSFSWAFMVMLVPTVYNLIMGYEIYIFTRFIPVFIMNLMIHMSVDHMKANLKIINLVKDQSIHLFQIILTWAIVLSIIP